MGTTTGARFQRAGRRGGRHELSDPLPPTLLGPPELAAEAARHRKVAGRVAKLRDQFTEAGRKLGEATAADEAAAKKATLDGRAAPRPKALAARAELDQIETEIPAAEDALGESADQLLEKARPHISAAAEAAAAEQEHAIARAPELVAATDAELDRASTLSGEIDWLEAAGGPLVEPYRQLDRDLALRQLRGALNGAFAAYLEGREKARAEAERRRRWEDEHQAEWERQEAQAREESEKRRVVTAGMQIIERGGVPVGEHDRGAA